MPAIALLVCQENTVNLLPISKPRAVLVWLAAGLAAGLSGAAIAQTPAATATSAPASSAPEFRSALKGYLPYTEEKTINWKEANDLTGRIGGWRAYAREAQQPAAAVKPLGSSPADPHAGHGKPAQVKP